MRHIIIGRGALFALIAVLAAFASIVGWDTASAQSSADDPNSVRITARFVEDGRIEFALLHRSDSPILPSKRYFPASPSDDRWLYASAQTLTADDGTVYTVRIAARRLADGRTEFGMQAQRATGWSNAHLPTSRFFPANTAVGRWLRSSQILLTEVGDPVPANVPLRTGEIFLRHANLDGYAWNGLEPSLYYGTENDPLDDTLFTWVVARANTDDDLYNTIRLQAACFPSGEYGVQFWEDGLPYDGGDPVSVRYRINDGEVVAESWWASRDGDSVFASAEFERAIAGADKLVVRMSFYSRTLTATFTGLRAMWNTPVQPNLDYCGRY